MKSILFSIFFLLLCNPSFAAEDCDQFIQSLPANTFKGWIYVPENWADSQSKKIKVFYWGFHFKENPNASPLVYFNGGPGGSSHGMGVYLKNMIHYPKVPFLFIDQRGTGCSDPLPPIEYTREGIQKTALYGARAIVMDAEAIRMKVFHGNKWRIFGQSYGSIIVHRYLELAPRGLLAAFAHGASLMTDGIAWTENRIRAFKRVGEEYFKQYPEDRTKITLAHLLFPKNYCVHSSDADICGDGLLDQFAWSWLSFPEFGLWKKLHDRIQKLLLPTGDLDLAYIQELFPAQSGDDPSSLLVDVVPAREAPGGLCNTWSCELALKRMESNGEHPMDYEFNECRLEMGVHRKFDYRLITEIVGEDYPSLQRIHHHLRLYPRLQFFLYTGEMDTFGPQENAREELKLFKNRVNYRAYHSGHGAFFEEEQTWKDILSTQ